MKSATLFLVSVLVFAFTSPSLSVSVHTVDDDLVLDAGGNPLQKGVDYVISLPFWGAAGGVLELAPPVEINETCEADVILVRPGLIPRDTFTFTPVKSSEDVIKLGHPLAIQSPSHNPCGDSTVWKVSTRDGLLAPIITTGGIINTGPSCLVINKAHSEFLPNLYMFEYCPYMCGGAKTCWPLGIYPSETSDGYVKEHLSTNPVSPFSFVLIKKSEAAAKKELASF